MLTQKTKQACRTLNLRAFPTPAELKAAYRIQIKKWHPDRYAHDAALERQALEKTKQLNEAYQHLLRLHLKRPRILARRPRRRNMRLHLRWHNLQRQRQTAGFPDPEVVEFYLPSPVIVSAGYNEQTQTLYLKYLGNEIHRYAPVPYAVFAEFLFAKTPHKFAAEHIYPRFTGQTC